jgi:hypothetical protein
MARPGCIGADVKTHFSLLGSLFLDSFGIERIPMALTGTTALLAFNTMLRCQPSPYVVQVSWYLSSIQIVYCNCSFWLLMLPSPATMAVSRCILGDFAALSSLNFHPQNAIALYDTLNRLVLQRVSCSCTFRCLDQYCKAAITTVVEPSRTTWRPYTTALPLLSTATMHCFACGS